MQIKTYCNLHYNLSNMKTPVTMRLSAEAIAALEYIAKHYGIDRTAAATLAFIEWANVLRERERVQAADDSKPPAANKN